MKPLQLEFEATVYWVHPAEKGYVDAPSGMRRFRSLGQATAFVVRALPSELKRDVRVLTADKTLMYDEVAALGAVQSQHSQATVLLPARRFGLGQS